MSQCHFFVQFYILVFSLFLSCTKLGLCEAILDTEQLSVDDYGTTNLTKNTCNIELENIIKALTLNLGERIKPPRDDYRCTPYIGYHKFHTRSKNWNTARKICIEEGGHLAIINSKAEALVMADIFKSAGFVQNSYYSEEAWIGIHDHFVEGEWVTVLDQSLASTGFTQWTNKWGGQPDNGNGGQNCGAFLKEGMLDDNVCNVTLPFFCEIPFDSPVYTC